MYNYNKVIIIFNVKNTSLLTYLYFLNEHFFYCVCLKKICKEEMFNYM